MAAETTLECALSDGSATSLTLERPHTSKASPLRAWSAADVLAIEHLANQPVGKLLIVNDEFGALCVAFAEHEPMLWSDSALSRAATDSNLVRNGLAELGSRSVSGDAVPPGTFDTALLRIPKTTALLIYQLEQLAPLLATEATVVGAGMTRHIHRSTVDAFESLVGPTTTSLAKRKARLILSEPRAVSERSAPTQSLPRAASERSAPTQSLWPSFTTADGLLVAERPGVFSAGHLDVGTALLLASIDLGDATDVIDLGCGNGVVAATLAAQAPPTKWTLTDVSDLAIEAARETWSLNQLANEARFVVGDGLGSFDAACADLVVSNPPFHQGHALDEELTAGLMAGAARVLRDDGRLVIVVQRHLNMHTRLRRWFGDISVVSKHPSHVVICAADPKRAR